MRAVKTLLSSLCALLVVSACEGAAPPPEPSCPRAELVEAIHAAAFHFDHGPVSTARTQLDRARSLAGGRSDRATDRLLAELATISQLVDEDPGRAHLENERLRMRLGDWRCLREPAHSALHAKLPPIEGAPRPELPMVSVSSARFEMGCDPARDPQCSPDERPAHSVAVHAFAIDRAEVSQGAYRRCVLAGSCTAPARGFDPEHHPRRPVAHVTWQQARDFCRWMRRRLPSEAEWELAARGTDGRVYPWGDTSPTCERAQTADCGGPSDVGQRPLGASPSGALDMAGNVDEWTEDVYVRYGAPRPRPVADAQRVARGGANDAWHTRATARMALAPDYHDATLGFRCASGAPSHP